MQAQRVVRVVLGGMLAAVLISCNGVGNGAKPESLTISKASALLGNGAKSDTAFVCFPEPLALRMTFDNGHYDSSFAYRARWSSSNPDVAAVSNGEILVPGSTTSAYAAGVLIPKKAGTTTITATFSSLSTSFDVTVAEPESFTIEPASLSMAKHSSSAIVAVKAVLAGYERNVTTAAEWAFTDADQETPDDSTDNSPDDIAVVGASTGVVVAGKTLGTRVLQATFSGCPEGSTAAAKAANLQTTVNVRELKTLTLTGEFDPAQPINVMTVPATDDKTATVATTEAMTVTGGFGDGVSETQDLSGQVTMKSSDAEVALPSSSNILAVKAGSVTVTATYPSLDINDDPIYDDVDPVTSNAVAVTVGERTLKSLAIDPADEQTIDALDSLQYHAIATFTDDSTQDITRHVAWTFEDTAEDPPSYVKLALGNGALLGGKAVSAAIPDPGPDAFNITATSGTGDNAKTATVKLNVQAKP